MIGRTWTTACLVVAAWLGGCVTHNSCADLGVCSEDGGDGRSASSDGSVATDGADASASPADDNSRSDAPIAIDVAEPVPQSEPTDAGLEASNDDPQQDDLQQDGAGGQPAMATQDSGAVETDDSDDPENSDAGDDAGYEGNPGEAPSTSSDAGDASTPAEPEPAEPGFELKAPPYIRMQQGQSVEVAVEIVRDPGFLRAIKFDMEGLPAGVAAESIQIAGDETATTLEISASMEAAFGGPTRAQLRATWTSDATKVQQSEVRTYVVGPTGTFDPTYGDEGVSLLPVTGGDDFPSGIAIDSEHRLVIAGSEQGDAYVGWLQRVTPNGIRDESFGSGGVVDDFGGPESGTYAVVLDDNGITVSASSGEADAVRDKYLRRFLHDGTIDATFGVDGNYAVDDSVYRLFSDGARLLMGVGIDLIEIDAQGRNPITWWSTQTGAADSFMFDREGRLCIGLSFFDGTRLETERWLAPGQPDPDFGVAGVSSILAPPYTTSTAVPAILAASDGSIVWMGEANYGGIYEAEVSLMKQDQWGTLDPTFGTAGKRILSPAALGLTALIQGDGKILSHYYKEEGPSGIEEREILHRVTPDGEDDESFGDGGVLAADLDSAEIAIDQEGGWLLVVDWGRAGDRIVPRARRLWL